MKQQAKQMKIALIILAVVLALIFCLFQAHVSHSQRWLDPLPATSPDTANVQYITTEDYAPEQMKAFLENGGIVVDTRTSDCQSTEKDSEIPFSAYENSGLDMVSDNSGKDIATLYYQYGDGLDGVYIINIGMDDTVNQEALIQEAIDVIRTRQTSNTANTMKTITTDTPELSAYTAKALKTFDVTTIREPIGKVNVTYTVYTIQDHRQTDYYIIQTTVTGYPGSALGSAYKGKYQGEGMHVTIGTPTTSVTVNDNGKSCNTTNAAVSTTGTPTSRTWDIQLIKETQKAFFDFSSSVTFDCPYNKPAVEISVYASYDLDSWNTFPKTIFSDRVITCTDSVASIS